MSGVSVSIFVRGIPIFQWKPNKPNMRKFLAKCEFLVTVTLESNVSIIAFLLTINVETTVKKSLTASLIAPIQEGVVMSSSFWLLT